MLLNDQKLPKNFIFESYSSGIGLKWPQILYLEISKNDLNHTKRWKTVTVVLNGVFFFSLLKQAERTVGPLQ